MNNSSNNYKICFEFKEDHDVVLFLELMALSPELSEFVTTKVAYVRMAGPSNDTDKEVKE